LYGTGLSTFAVVAVPRNIANDAADAATKAGGASETLTAGSGVFLSITPLSLAIVRPPRGRNAYLLTGLVTPQVLRAVADELSQLNRGSR
jgi:hypothetical protein